MVERRRYWFSTIIPQHMHYPIKQVYARIYIKKQDSIIIVSKDWSKRQLPWGKPKAGERILQTLFREIYEETSLSLSEITHSIKYCDLFGYYHIIENWEWYLQLRYCIILDDIILDEFHSNENFEEDSINYVKKTTLWELIHFIPWLKTNEELSFFNKTIGNLPKILPS